MAFSSGFFNAKGNDRTYTAENFCDYLSSMICDGIQENFGDCFVPKTNGLKITIGSGKAWIKGHYFISDSTYTIDLSNYVDESLPRYIIVGICCNTAEDTRTISLKFMAGTPATAPTIPKFTNTDEKTYLTLCALKVNAGATSMTVTDYRDNEKLCGYVRCILGSCRVLEMISEIAKIRQEISGLSDGTLTEAVKELLHKVDNSTETVKFEKDSDGRMKYKMPDGKYATGEVKINGIPFLFGADGILKTGWRTVFGKRYYYDQNTGQFQIGMIDYSGNKYYVTVNEGKLVNQHFTADGIRYWCDGNGIVKEA